MALIDIVIPAYNTASTLDVMLPSLQAQTLPKKHWCAYLVDDGSTEDLTPIVKKFGENLPLRYIRLETNLGRSPARNAGIAAGSSPVVLFLDADSIAGPDLVERHAVFHERHLSPCASSVTGSAADDGANMLAGARYETGWDWLGRVLAGDLSVDGGVRDPNWREREGLVGDDQDLGRSPTPWTAMWGCNLSVPRKVLDEVGGFDTSLRGWGMDDLEFAYRIFRWLDRDSSRFHYDRHAYCFHLPQTRDATRQMRELAENLKHVRNKYRHYEIELLRPQRAAAHRDAVGYYNETLAGFVKHRFGVPPDELITSIDGNAPLLIVGGGADWSVRRSGRTVTFDYAAPESDTNFHLLGLSLPFPDQSFEALVNVDLWRHTRLRELQSLALEGLRKAKSVYLVDSCAARALDDPTGGSGAVSARDKGVTRYVVEMLSAMFELEQMAFGDAEAIHVKRRLEPGSQAVG